MARTVGKGLKVLKVQLAQPVRKETKAHKVHKDTQVLKDQKEA